MLKQEKSLLVRKTNNSKKPTNFKAKSIKLALLGLVPVVLGLGHAYGAFDIDAGMKAATEPVKKMINDYYPVGIFIAGAFGAFMQQQGDLRDKMMGFGKGALTGGLVVAAVKTGLGV